MKLSDIKTEEQFYKFKNSQHNRALRLSVIYDDEKESAARRDKAKKLWYIMFFRIMALRFIELPPGHYFSNR